MKTSPNKARRLPVFELRPQASHEEVVARVNALHQKAAALENITFVGGTVHQSNGNIVIVPGESTASAPIADTSAPNPLQSSTPSSGTPPKSPSETAYELQLTDLTPVTYGDISTKLDLVDLTLLTPEQIEELDALGGGYVSVEIYARTKGGTATLIGFDEFVASTPPRKLLRSELSGAATQTGYTNGSCTTTTGVVLHYPYGGYCEYSPITGISTSYGLVNSTPPHGCRMDVYPSNCIVNTTATATQYTETGTNSCCLVSGNNVRYSGTVTNTLSIESTDDDAVDRLRASSPSFGALSAISIETGAFWQERTSGFSFNYKEAEIKVAVAAHGGALAEGDTCMIIVNLYESDDTVEGGGATVPFETHEIEVTIDSSGMANAIIPVVPVNPGTSIYVHSTEVRK